ncbi:hypothetical protein IPM62_00900 [Candidatus Woesebacteria bacterium]|nr:MAG: hypothetical protein IPM62_00900 [Candidatus Woesebacteria bacterium]
MTNKGFIQIVVIIIVFVVVGISTIVYLHPTDYQSCMKLPGSSATKMIPSTCTTFWGINFRQDDSSNSEISQTATSQNGDYVHYYNDRYGFSFEYPKYLVLEEKNDGSYINLKREVISDPSHYDDNFYLDVSVQTISNKNLGDFYLESYCETLRGSSITFDTDHMVANCIQQFEKSKSELVIAGKDALRANNIYFVSERIITVINNGSYINFILYPGGEEGSGISKKAIDTYDHILASIKFDQ